MAPGGRGSDILGIVPRFPQDGGCVCGDLRYTLRKDPVVVYACHCTDCQTETGSTCYLAVVVESASFEYTRGKPATFDVTLADGRTKGAVYCPRCVTATGGESRIPGLASVNGGTLDDSSWIVPAGHIWTRSAQPWLKLPEDSLQFPMQPSDEDTMAMVRAWKATSAG